MTTNFEKFCQGFQNVDKDWDGMINVFAPDADVHYSFAGFPDIRAGPVEANAGFKTFLKRFRVKFTYLSGSEKSCMYSCSAFYELTNGKGSLYTSYGYLEFNEEGKVTKKTSFSDDTQELAGFITDAMKDASAE